MKGRGPYRRSYIDGTEVASREFAFIQRSKLLSSRGCDISTQVEDERATSDSYPGELSAFYKSIPEYNEEQYELDLSGSYRSEKHSEGN